VWPAHYLWLSKHPNVLHPFRRAIRKLRDTLSQRQLLLLASSLVGLFSGLTAIVLKTFVHWINTRATLYAEGYQQFFLFTLFPVVGIGLSVAYVRVMLKKGLKRGSSEIVYSIAKKSSNISADQVHGQIVTSGLTVGLGGSVGLESPLVSSGAAIGSVLGRWFKMIHKERTVLLACGAASGIAAAFNSPIAGVLFAIEVLLIDVAASAFIPLIIASASGALLSKIILQEGVLLSFSMARPFDIGNVPFYVVLGVLAGLISTYYARVFTRIDAVMVAIPRTGVRILAGGGLLAALLILFPPLFGEGYAGIKLLAEQHTEELIRNSILFNALSNDWWILLFLTILMLVKVFATAITLGSGGNGGNFAPSLFVGGYLGFAFSRALNLLHLGHFPESNFILVGMAGILSGVFYAPLTGIFLIAEITGGYGLMIPLMIVSSISITVARYFEPVSMEARKLSGLWLENKDRYLLSKLDFAGLIEKDFHPVREDDTLGDLVQVISRSKRNLFPVLSNTGELVGLVLLDHVRETMFNTSAYSAVHIREIMTDAPAVIKPHEELHSVLRKFDETHQWSLPVTEHGKYLGFVSKSSILEHYRSELMKTV
jgi:CIC family chloride channel protein